MPEGDGRADRLAGVALCGVVLALLSVHIVYALATGQIWIMGRGWRIHGVRSWVDPTAYWLALMAMIACAAFLLLRLASQLEKIGASRKR